MITPIIESLKIEYHIEEGHSVTLGIHTEHPPWLMASEIMMANMKSFHFDNPKF